MFTFYGLEGGGIVIQLEREEEEEGSTDEWAGERGREVQKEKEWLSADSLSLTLCRSKTLSLWQLTGGTQTRRFGDRTGKEREEKFLTGM